MKRTDSSRRFRKQLLRNSKREVIKNLLGDKTSPEEHTLQWRFNGLKGYQFSKPRMIPR